MTTAWIILGNGMTGRQLADIKLPSSVRVISQNRVYPYGTNDVVVISHPCYLEYLPGDIAVETVYVPASWPDYQGFNRIDAPENSIHMSMQLLKNWGQLRACAIGWDAVVFDESDASVLYPPTRGVRQHHQGHLQGTLRWRRQLVEAQRQTGVVIIPMVSPRELQNWLSAVAK